MAKGQIQIKHFPNFKLLDKIDHKTESYGIIACDIVFQILLFLDTNDYYSFVQVCKTFHNVGKLPAFWKEYFKHSYTRKFKLMHLQGLKVKNWQFEYKKQKERSQKYYEKKYKEVIVHNRNPKVKKTKMNINVIWIAPIELNKTINTFFNQTNLFLEMQDITFYTKTTNINSSTTQFEVNQFRRLLTKKNNESSKFENVHAMFLFFSTESKDSLEMIEKYLYWNLNSLEISDIKIIVIGLIGEEMKKNVRVDYSRIFQLKNLPNVIDYVEVDVKRKINLSVPLGLVLDEYNLSNLPNIFFFKK